MNSILPMLAETPSGEVLWSLLSGPMAIFMMAVFTVAFLAVFVTSCWWIAMMLKRPGTRKHHHPPLRYH